jgi:hypothetical protein
MRLFNGRLTRKTLGFSKELEMYRATAAWEDLVYNFARPVRTLRVEIRDGSKRRWEVRTPAMAAGLTDHIWIVKELLTTVALPNNTQEGDYPKSRFWKSRIRFTVPLLTVYADVKTPQPSTDHIFALRCPLPPAQHVDYATFLIHSLVLYKGVEIQPVLVPLDKVPAHLLLPVLVPPQTPGMMHQVPIPEQIAECGTTAAK